MKKLKKLKTGLVKRNISFAKMATKIGKDFYFSKKEDLNLKISETLIKRTGLLKNELGELKGSFLKAGQMLALYSQDLLPKEFSDILTQLQGQTSYLEWESISKQLDPLHITKLEIEQDAFAAASIGQVHKAKQGNKTFALKIQYKNIEKLIDSDLWMLKKLLNILKIVPKAYDFTEVFEEIKKMLQREMDYEQELYFAKRFKSLAADDYIIPEFHEEFCTEKVLCMDYIEADTIDDYLLKASSDQKKSLAISFFQLFLKEIFIWRIMQSDAHNGNYMIKEDKWVLIDFGATKEITGDLYQNLIEGLFQQDRDLIEKTLQDHGAMNMQETDLDYFWEYCKMISDPLQNQNYDWSTSTISQDVMSKSKEIQNKVKFNWLPHENIFIDRKIGGVYFMLKKLGVKINLREIYNQFKVEFKIEFKSSL